MLLFASGASPADDLGTIGPAYLIAEPYFLADLERRLQAKKASGEWDRLTAQQRARAEALVRQPAAVAGLVATRSPRTFYVDPSLTLDRNVFDANGQLMFVAGTRKNPLDVVSLSSPLMLFDGRDPRQRDQAQRLITQRGGRVTPVLVGGSSLELMQAWQKPVFFDQSGRLSSRLGIRQVPCAGVAGGRTPAGR